ncbi:virulence factor SrfB [Succinimonas amylolytica]|uniref:virulence factor SrfB n=1 Tax=Succinimonas amylolytica TaxID=83769 RepID=UPI0023A7E91E
MIPEIPKFSENDRLVLFQNTGVQFLDLDLDFSDTDARDRLETFQFSPEMHLLRAVRELSGDEVISSQDRGRLLDLVTRASLPPGNFEKIHLEDVLNAFAGRWVPLPYFLDNSSAPLNWCRGYIKQIAVNRYRLVLAFDTATSSGDQSGKGSEKHYLSDSVVSSGLSYSLCDRFDRILGFLEEGFMKSLLEKYWKDFMKRSEKSPSRIQTGLTSGIWKGFYQALLFVLLDRSVTGRPLPHGKNLTGCPPVVVRPFSRNGEEPIEVTMVLDIGNSRVCGLLLEGRDSLKSSYSLELRDLSSPEQVYRNAFSSSVEFASPSFSLKFPELGYQNFEWNSLVRTGNEAMHLSWLLSGNESRSGMSSPKRYLWDEDRARYAWIFNPHTDTDNKPNLLESRIASLVNGAGVPLYREPDSYPAMESGFSRSSLMMLLLMEIIAQAEQQINGISSRWNGKQRDTPRMLRNIILTVPPGMPLEEVAIFRRHLEDAVAVFWRAMKWDLSDPMTRPDFSSQSVWPPYPECEIKWDEAFSSQAVYLYNEVTSKYSGHWEDFWRVNSLEAVRNPDSPEKKITIATVDIGGGTTDFVINDYRYGEGGGIIPGQRFHESFKVAGDDLLLDIIQTYVIPSVRAYLTGRLGFSESFAEDYIFEKLGSEPHDNSVQHSTSRKQLTLQVLCPVAVAIINSYQDFGTEKYRDLDGRTFGQILKDSGRDLGSDETFARVEAFFSDELRRKKDSRSISLLDVVLNMDIRLLHERLATCSSRYDICSKAISFIAEVINQYRCDIVLLSGHPSTLPGIVSAFRNKVDLTPSRIVQMSSLRVGDWYPFASGGRIRDPKTAVAVGAMIAYLSEISQVENFYLKVGSCRLRSNIRYIGALDTGGRILNSSLFYSGVDLEENSSYKFENSFRVSGRMTIGSRPVKIERWPATPLYKLTLDEKLSRSIANISESYIELCLDRAESTSEDSGRYQQDRLVLKDVTRVRGCSGSTRDSIEVITEGENANVFLKLCTLPDSKLGENDYWLDNGVVCRR